MADLCPLDAIYLRNPGSQYGPVEARPSNLVPQGERCDDCDYRGIALDFTFDTEEVVARGCKVATTILAPQLAELQIRTKES